MNWPGIWEWLNLNSGAVSAIATVTAALVAALALVSAAADSSRRTRPMLIAELRKAPHNDFAAILVIRNDGPTPAKSVRIQFDPPLVSYPKSASMVERMAGAIAHRYNDRTIPFLNPKQELANVWYKGPGENKLPLPIDFSLTMSYQGTLFRRHIHISFQGDVALYENDTISSTSQLGALRKISKHLEGIKALTASVEQIAKQK